MLPRFARCPPPLATVFLLLGACTDAPPDAITNAPERVTAGDTVVVRTRGDMAPDAEWQLVEQWRAGSTDGDAATSFSLVHSLAITDDAHVLVFDQGGPVLRRYAPNGTLVRAIGRKGSGPGEYERVNGVAVRTDGQAVLWAGAGSSRLNVYAPTDSFVTQWAAPVSGYGTSDQSLVALTDNRVAVRAYVRDSTLRREAIGRTAWFVYDASGVARDTVLQPELNDATVMLIARNAGSASSRPVPYQPRPVAALLLDGTVAWSPGTPYVVHGRHEGKPLRIERDARALPVTDTEREQLRAQVIWGMRQTDPNWIWDGPDIPSTKPAVRDVTISLDGQYLVHVSTASEPFEPEPPRVVEGETPRPLVRFRSPTTYELFSADGAMRGRFTLPRGATVHAVRGDDVWGTVTDDDDVPYLVHWRLQRATPRD
jgi:hypothetical protein